MQSSGAQQDASLQPSRTPSRRRSTPHYAQPQQRQQHRQSPIPHDYISTAVGASLHNHNSSSRRRTGSRHRTSFGGDRNADPDVLAEFAACRDRMVVAVNKRRIEGEEDAEGNSGDDAEDVVPSLVDALQQQYETTRVLARLVTAMTVQWKDVVEHLRTAQVPISAEDVKDLFVPSTAVDRSINTAAGDAVPASTRRHHDPDSDQHRRNTSAEDAATERRRRCTGSASHPSYMHEALHFDIAGRDEQRQWTAQQRRRNDEEKKEQEEERARHSRAGGRPSEPHPYNSFNGRDGKWSNSTQRQLDDYKRAEAVEDDAAAVQAEHAAGVRSAAEWVSMQPSVQWIPYVVQQQEGETGKDGASMRGRYNGILYASPMASSPTRTQPPPSRPSEKTGLNQSRGEAAYDDATHLRSAVLHGMARSAEKTIMGMRQVELVLLATTDTSRSLRSWATTLDERQKELALRSANSPYSDVWLTQTRTPSPLRQYVQKSVDAEHTRCDGALSHCPKPHARTQLSRSARTSSASPRSQSRNTRTACSAAATTTAAAGAGVGGRSSKRRHSNGVPDTAPAQAAVTTSTKLVYPAPPVEQRTTIYEHSIEAKSPVASPIAPVEKTPPPQQAPQQPSVLSTPGAATSPHSLLTVLRGLTPHHASIGQRRKRNGSAAALSALAQMRSTAADGCSAAGPSAPVDSSSPRPPSPVSVVQRKLDWQAPSATSTAAAVQGTSAGDPAWAISSAPCTASAAAAVNPSPSSASSAFKRTSAFRICTAAQKQKSEIQENTRHRALSLSGHAAALDDVVYAEAEARLRLQLEYDSTLLPLVQGLYRQLRQCEGIAHGAASTFAPASSLEGKEKGAAGVQAWASSPVRVHERARSGSLAIASVSLSPVLAPAATPAAAAAAGTVSLSPRQEAALHAVLDGAPFTSLSSVRPSEGGTSITRAEQRPSSVTSTSSSLSFDITSINSRDPAPTETSLTRTQQQHFFRSTASPPALSPAEPAVRTESGREAKEAVAAAPPTRLSVDRASRPTPPPPTPSPPPTASLPCISSPPAAVVPSLQPTVLAEGTLHMREEEGRKASLFRGHHSPPPRAVTAVRTLMSPVNDDRPRIGVTAVGTAVRPGQSVLSKQPVSSLGRAKVTEGKAPSRGEVVALELFPESTPPRLPAPAWQPVSLPTASTATSRRAGAALLSTTAVNDGDSALEVSITRHTVRAEDKHTKAAPIVRGATAHAILSMDKSEVMMAEGSTIRIAPNSADSGNSVSVSRGIVEERQTRSPFLMPSGGRRVAAEEDDRDMREETEGELDSASLVERRRPAPSVNAVSPSAHAEDERGEPHDTSTSSSSDTHHTISSMSSSNSSHDRSRERRAGSPVVLEPEEEDGGTSFSSVSSFHCRSHAAARTPEPSPLESSPLASGSGQKRS